MIARDTQVGREFSGRPKKMSWARIAAFSGGPLNTPGWPRKNIHTDLEAARDAGLDTVYVSATQYLGHLAELMIDLFGENWLGAGRTTGLKFIAPVAAGDTLRTWAKVCRREEEGPEVEFTFEVWCENQNGDRVLVGEATGRV